MRELINYINEILKIQIDPKKLPNSKLHTLPIFITETYELYETELLNHSIILAFPKNTNELSILQTHKNFEVIREKINPRVALVLPNISSYNRKRLIQNALNFIVPHKHLYLMDLFLHLGNNFIDPRAKPKNNTLMPSAQFLLFYFLLTTRYRNNNWNIENHTFKEIGNKTSYSSMAITKAVANLEALNLVDVISEAGVKEKRILFNYRSIGAIINLDKPRQFLINPVKKQVYIDELPNNNFLLKSNNSALPEYTSMNPTRQQYYAISAATYKFFKESELLINENPYEGRYCLEVWKYDPNRLADLVFMDNDQYVVDPISLYLTMRDSNDERVEMAMDELINENL